MGLEPTTSSLGSWHSTIELRPLTSNDNSNAEGSGQSNHLSQDRRRRAKIMGQMWDRIYSGNPQRVFLSKTGADDVIRTRNAHIGKLMRYRCATPAQEGGKKIVKDLIRVNPRPQSALIRVEVTRNQVVPTAL